LQGFGIFYPSIDILHKIMYSIANALTIVRNLLSIFHRRARITLKERSFVMFATLRQRNFALLWFAGLISVTGDWILNIGLPIYVYLLTRSVLDLSITLLASSIPNILLGSVAGVFVDRWNRKRTMVITNLLLALALLPLLLARTPDRVWIIYLVAFVETCLEQFFTPAQNAFLPTLLDEAQLVPANSLISLGSNFARLVGPALGGLIAAVFALNGIVLADAASFLVACILVSFITNAPKLAAKEAEQEHLAPVVDAEKGAIANLWHEWVDGMRVIGSERTLSVLLAMFSLTMLGEGVFGVLYPVFVYRILHGGALQIGQLMSAQAIGGLLGGVLVGWMGKRIMTRWAIGLLEMAFGFIDLLIFNSPAFFPFYWLSVGLFITVGVVSIGPSTGAQSLLQAKSPDAYRGRIFGALGMTMGLFALIGTLTAGLLTDHLGVVTVLNLQAIVYMLGGLMILVLLPRAKKGTGKLSSKDASIQTNPPQVEAVGVEGQARTE
jgi:MFS family permease